MERDDAWKGMHLIVSRRRPPGEIAALQSPKSTGTCLEPGCGQPLYAGNQAGVCRKHWRKEQARRAKAGRARQ